MRLDKKKSSCEFDKNPFKANSIFLVLLIIVKYGREKKNLYYIIFNQTK